MDVKESFTLSKKHKENRTLPVVVGVSVVASGVVWTALAVVFCHGRFGTGAARTLKAFVVQRIKEKHNILISINKRDRCNQHIVQ